MVHMPCHNAQQSNNILLKYASKSSLPATAATSVITATTNVKHRLHLLLLQVAILCCFS
jgi:hypothetical protein